MSDREAAVLYRRPNTTHTRIGGLVDMNAPRFPGLLARDLGFGLDMSADIEASFLATLALRPKPPMFFDRTPWQSEEVRDAYRRDIFHWFGDSQLPLAETRTTEVTARLDQLQPERVYRGIAFDQVSHLPGQPELLHYPAFSIDVTWRHHQFAQLVIVERLPHLRTTEMAHPAQVWQRINALFAAYLAKLRNQSFALLRLKEQQAETLALNFALYERLLFLRYEEAVMSAAYQRAIYHRIPDPEHPSLLQLESPATDQDHDHQLEHRRSRYADLITNLHHRTVHQIVALSPTVNRS